MSGIRASCVSCARVAPRVRAGVSSVSALRETNKQFSVGKDCWSHARMWMSLLRGFGLARSFSIHGYYFYFSIPHV